MSECCDRPDGELSRRVSRSLDARGGRKRRAAWVDGSEEAAAVRQIHGRRYLTAPPRRILEAGKNSKMKLMLAGHGSWYRSISRAWACSWTARNLPGREGSPSSTEIRILVVRVLGLTMVRPDQMYVLPVPEVTDAEQTPVILACSIPSAALEISDRLSSASGFSFLTGNDQVHVLDQIAAVRRAVSIRELAERLSALVPGKLRQRVPASVACR